MRIGTQFNGTVPANSTRRWFTHSWPPSWHVLWHVVPTSPNTGGAQVDWEVDVQRADANRVTYWITVRNLSSQPANVDARYAIMN